MNVIVALVCLFVKHKVKVQSKMQKVESFNRRVRQRQKCVSVFLVSNKT